MLTLDNVGPREHLRDVERHNSGGRVEVSRELGGGGRAPSCKQFQSSDGVSTLRHLGGVPRGKPR